MAKAKKRSPRLNRRWVETLVKDALGEKRAHAASRGEINRLARKFVLAGRDAVRVESASAAQAAEILERTTRRLTDVRSRLAEASKSTHGPLLVDPSFRILQRALMENKERLMRYPDVVGLKPGFRIEGGKHTDEPCVTVFVRRKWTSETLRKRARPEVPRYLEAPDGSRILTDVIELGRLETQASAGSSIGGRGDQGEGTLGAFGHDKVSGKPVAFTAMHVVSETLQRFPAAGVGPIDFVSPARTSSVFGTLVRGVRPRVDAASIELTPPDQPRTPSPLGESKGWRRLTFPGDVGAGVKLFGAKSHMLLGAIRDPGVFLDPNEYSIDFAIIADIPTRRGDSGAALLDGDNFLLGFLHGAAPRLGETARLFVPAGRFLDDVGAALP